MPRNRRLPLKEIIDATNDSDTSSMIANIVSLCSNLSSSESSASDCDSSEDTDNADEDDSERKANLRVFEGKPKYTDSVSMHRKPDVSSDAHGLTSMHDLGGAPYSYPNCTTINPSVIEQIEDDLDFYEKVSLVFLLYDSDDLALQRLITAYRQHTSGSLSHCRPLTDWALHESSDNWTDKFLEALSIIGNFKWIRRLGYTKDEIMARFLPYNKETSLFVDMMRKALYITIESLSVLQLENLLSLVVKDMETQGRISARYDPEFMEMNVLHWMSQRYLNVVVFGSCDSINIKNLTKHLKVIEEFDLSEYLEKTAKRCCRTPDSYADSTFSDQLSVRSAFSHTSASAHSVVSQCQEASLPISRVYNIDPKNVGFCVIINQKIFYKETNPALKHLVYEDYFEPRIGTDIDRDRLCEVFLNFGFTVKIWENLTHIELVRAIHFAVSTLVKKEHGCFALCILSHGRKNAVYGVNSIAVEMDEIEKLLHGKYCPNLLQKPKIIIIQACQGLVKQNAMITDISADGAIESRSCPEVSDILTFWATVPGYAAFRDRLRGSWFVKEIWEELLEKSCFGLDVLSICVDIIAAVSNKRAPLDGELKAMTPQFSTSFRKKLVFPYHRDARKAAAKRMLERYMFSALFDKFLQKLARKIHANHNSQELEELLHCLNFVKTFQKV